MAKTVIFIASRTEQENYIIQKKLEPLETEFRGIGFSGVHPVGLAASIDGSTGIVVLNVGEWTNLETSHIRELSNTGYRGPILVIAKSEINKAITALKATPNVVFLAKPFDTKNLLGIVRKMLMARAVSQQVHKRFATSQTAHLEVNGRDEKVPSRVCNLSKGGAYLEFITPVPLRIGEILKLKMELKELNRTYLMSAKVIWTEAVHRGSTRGVGVEFIGGDMLKKMILGF